MVHQEKSEENPKTSTREDYLEIKSKRNSRNSNREENNKSREFPEVKVWEKKEKHYVNCRILFED